MCEANKSLFFFFSFLLGESWESRVQKKASKKKKKKKDFRRRAKNLVHPDASILLFVC
jgi:hypothetical protein